MSFQISLTPTRRAAGRFVGEVRDKLLKGLEDRNRKTGLTQSDVAKTIGVHRSVINRELRGRKDITLGRVAELATSMGLAINFDLVETEFKREVNAPVLMRGNEIGKITLQRQAIGSSAASALSHGTGNKSAVSNLIQAEI